ncbi:MAG TPA: GtrA family protein [Beijerinckiaceae bacterium]|jgi:putative flippase GtrA|nr:GtrA family protein [Beijerinckiaceae bacterium]
MSFRRQFSSFFGVSLAAFVVDYGTLVLLRQAFGLDPVWGALAGYIAGGILSYALNRRHTFETDRSHAEAGWRFAVVMAVGFSLTGLFMYLFADRLGVPYIVARLLTTGLVFIWNFLAHRSWTFSASR